MWANTWEYLGVMRGNLVYMEILGSNVGKLGSTWEHLGAMQGNFALPRNSGTLGSNAGKLGST